MLEKARRKLILWNFGIAVLLLAIVILAMYFSISHNIEEEVAGELRDNARTILESSRFVPTSNPSTTSPTPVARQNEDDEDSKEHDNSEPDLREFQTEENLRVTVSNAFYFVVDTKGQAVENSRRITNPALPDLSNLPQVLQGQSVFKDISLESNIQLRLYSVPIRQSDGRVVGMLQLGKDLGVHQYQLKEVLTITGIVGGVGLGLALLAAFFLTERSLIPVRQTMQRQREFVADASHELRTPLTLIRANAEVILRAKNKSVAENAPLLEDICQETDYLTRLVSDLLVLARADMEKIEYKPEPVDLHKLGEEVIRQLTPLAESKKLNLQLEAEPGEMWIRGEPLRLRQLLLILLDNAIKYTNNGQVRLSLGKGKGHHQASTAIIEVKDTGVGIPSDKFDLIFERFYRLDKARSRSEGGFGLGLPIARWIVQHHKGTIHVNSQIGRGTTFTINLPDNLPAQL